MAIKTIRVFQEFTSAGYVPMPVAGNIDYGVTIANTFPATTPTTFQTDDPDIDVTLTATTDYYVWIRSHGTDWNPMYTRNVRVYPDSPLINNVVMGIIIANLDGTVPYTGATTNVDLGTYGLKADYLQLNTSPTATPATEGTFAWDSADGTANLRLKGGNINLQIGEDSVARVVNGTTANLLKADYKVVKIIGAQGQRLQIGLALADNDANSKDTIGLVAENINNNQEGFIMTSGLLDGINTTGSLQGETWNDGDTLYLSGTTAGKITNIKPQAPIHTIILGFVSYAHQNNGKIYVKVDNGYELDELHNVKIIGALNKDVLVYNSTTKLWENRIIFKTQGYVPYYDDTLLLNNSPLYTNGNNVAIGSLTLTEKLVVGGNVLANQFKKVGGLSTEFLKADGSSDATAYQPLSADLTAIDNLALTTGLLRKNGLNTWELDQTEYLSVAIAGSTYQTLANLSSNLTASTTKYPSVNAVNTGLALKLNLTGGTLTGGLTLNYSYPNIALSDVSSGTTWNIQNDGSTFKLNYGATNNFYIFSSGNAAFVNSLTASALIKSGGTSTQFLKADGSVDNTNYQPYDADLASIAGLELTTGLLRKNGLNTYTLDQTEYVALSTANSTYQTLANLQSNLNASSTKYPSVNAVNTGLNLKLNLAGGTLTGDLALAYSYPNIQLSDTSSGTIWNIQNDGGGLEFNSGTTNKFVMYSSGNATFVNDLTANKFIKSGGTSSQFLMADGSVSSGNAGTVTSVGLSAPTGFSVSGSPVTTSGTLALAFSAGYSLPSDATQATWTAKQNALNGTGFVKISGTTISYDNSTYYLASNPSGFTSNVGTVTSVGMSVPTGLSISGTPITTSGTLALSLTAGYSIPTTSSQVTWDTAFNRSLTSIGVSGTTTKTLTLTKQDGTTLTASWSDINTDAVTSVFGRTGAIVATSGDYTTAQVTESGNLYYLDSRARASLSFVAGSGAYNSTTGVITIPTNNNQITNGAGYITGITSGMVTTALGYTPVTNARTLTINGTAYDLSADRSWTISGTIGGLTSGYIPKATSASTLGNSLIYDNGTNIGIGTISPSVKLQVENNSHNYIFLNSSVANVQTSFSVQNTSSGKRTSLSWEDGTRGDFADLYTSTYLTFTTGTSEKIRLTPGGNLLVGTTTDSGYKLDVNGTARVQGDALYVYGTGSIELGRDTTYSIPYMTLGFGGRSNGFNRVYGARDTTDGIYISSATGRGIKLLTNGDTVNALTLASSGAATFSSSVSATSGVFSSVVNVNGASTLEALNVNGNIYLSGTANRFVRIQSATNYYYNLQSFNDDFRIVEAGSIPRLVITYPNGNVGIGTISPGSKLDVVGSGRFSGFDSVYYNENILAIGNSTYNPKIGLASVGGYRWNMRIKDVGGDGQFVIRYEEGSLDALTINRPGNLGLGVTPSAWSGINGKIFEIGYSGGSAALFQNAADDFWITSNAYYNAGWKYTKNGTATAKLMSTGGHYWYTAPSGTAGNAISFTQAMTLDASGNLMVGTTNSGYGKLGVYSASNTLIGIANSTSYAQLQQNGADLYINTNLSGATGGNLIFRFGAGATEAMRIASSTNVLIGTTTDSGYKLDVNGTGRFSGALTINQTAFTFGSGLNLLNWQLVSGGDSGLYIGYSGTTRLSIASTGAATFSSSVTAGGILQINNSSNISTIRTNSESSVFAIVSSSSLVDYKPRIELYGTSYGSGLSDTIIYRAATQIFTSSTAATERMRITSGGNVLIGTTTDSGAKLDVNGLGRFSGSLKLSSGGSLNVVPTSYGSNGFISFRNTADSATRWNIYNYTIGGSTYGSLNFSTNDGIDRLYLSETGAATFSSSVTASSFFESSDRTIKTLITDNYLVKGIESITAKLYTKHGKEELGYFAQDVQGILPSAVTKGTNGLLNLSYREVLVAKVQRTESEIDKLKQRVKELETQLNLG
jgi:hypothetical protein